MRQAGGDRPVKLKQYFETVATVARGDARNDQLEAWATTRYDVEKDASAPSADHALCDRAEWTAALSLGWSVVASTRTELLSVLTDAQKDLLFWQRRHHAPMQETLEQGPYGWIASARGLPLPLPSEHTKALADLMTPLFVALGATTRARDLVAGTLDFCDKASDITGSGAAGPTADDVFAAVLLASTPSVGSSATPSVSVPSAAGETAAELPRPSPLFTARGTPLYATRTLIGVLAACERAILATLVCLPDIPQQLLDKAKGAGADWEVPKAAASPRRLAKLLLDTSSAAAGLLDQIKLVAATHRRRWGLLRNWHRISTGSLAVVAGGAAMWTHRHELGSIARATTASVFQFVSDHLIEPGSDMLGELLSGTKREISDAKALAATRRSLAVFLEQYYTKHAEVMVAAGVIQPGAGADATAVAAKALATVQDVGPAELRFATEMQSPFTSSVVGTLPQLVLLQMTKLRAEAMMLMNAMDGLILSNDFTARMAAIVPFVAVVLGGAWAVRFALRMAFQPVPTSELKHGILLCVRDIDRLLAMAAFDSASARTSSPVGVAFPAEAAAAAATAAAPEAEGRGATGSAPAVAPPGSPARPAQSGPELHPSLPTPVRLAALATAEVHRRQRQPSLGSPRLASAGHWQLAGPFPDDSSEDGGDDGPRRHWNEPKTPAAGGDESSVPEAVLRTQDLVDLQGGLHKMSLRDLGSLELRLVGLRDLVGQLSAFLHEEEVARLHEDVADLSADELSARERRGVLQRMRHTYAFLTPTPREETLTSLFGLRLLG